jgi:hypothetical protein
VYGLLPFGNLRKASPHYEIQKEAWLAYKTIAHRWFNPDILVCAGDAIEGRQSKQGGAELVTTDRNVQSEMAVVALSKFKAKKILMVYGTSYHCGDQGEDFEYNIAKELDAKIEGRLYFNVEGLTFDVRHKVGTSGVYHSRATGLLRELSWDLIKEAEDAGPKVDVVVRAHAHYHIWIEDPKHTAFICPALQVSGGRYGSREMSGVTHWGAIRLTVHKGQIVNKERIIWNIVHANPKVLKLK